MSYLKLGKKTLKFLKKAKKSRAIHFDYEGYYRPWGKDKIKGKIDSINESVDVLTKLSRSWKKAKRDTFFKSRLANFSHSYKKSWMDSKKAYWKKKRTFLAKKPK